MDQGKGVLCVAEISITMLERFASYKEDIDFDIEKGHANIR